MSKRAGVSRFSVSVDKTLAREFDALRKAQGHKNRSLAIAELMRDSLVEHRQDSDDYDAAGAVTLVYDHHHSHIQEALTELQHHFLASIISTLHVHLDHHNCLEVIVLRGKALAIKKVAQCLIGARGVKHGKLSLTTAGKDLPP